MVIHWLIFPYPSGLLHWHCGNLTIAPVPAKQPWWIWINTSCEFIMNDCITTTKQSTTKPCAYFLGYTVAKSPVKLGHGGMITFYSKQWMSLLIHACISINPSVITHPFCNFNRGLARPLLMIGHGCVASYYWKIRGAIAHPCSKLDTGIACS